MRAAKSAWLIAVFLLMFPMLMPGPASGREPVLRNRIGMGFVFIPAGTFPTIPEIR